MDRISEALAQAKAERDRSNTTRIALQAVSARACGGFCTARPAPSTCGNAICGESGSSRIVRSHPCDGLRHAAYACSTSRTHDTAVIGAQFFSITSPTSGCGKTVTAINLALSIGQAAGPQGSP